MMKRAIKDLLGGVLEFVKRRKKVVVLSGFGSILLVSALIGIVVGVNNNNNNNKSEAIVKSSCGNTFYPELCYSTISRHPKVSNNLVKTQKDVIEVAVNITKTAVEKNYFQIKKLMSSRKGVLTPRALHDCLEMVSETLEELQKVEKGLQDEYYHDDTKHANDLKTLMSSTITDQETCLDGFSHEDADKKVRKELEKGQERVEKMCSNALAMICNMTNTHDDDFININNNSQPHKRKKLLMEEDDHDEYWPHWLSGGDRKLLQSGSVRPNVVVAADGSGNYRTVAAAVAAAPSKSSTRYVIRIKAGVYRENVEVPKAKTNIMFMGDGRKNTIITASRSVKGGSTTFESATVGTYLPLFLIHFQLYNCLILYMI